MANDLTGETFGSLFVLSKTKDRYTNGEILYKCRCICGNIVKLPKSKLTRQNTCGCRGKVAKKPLDQSTKYRAKQKKHRIKCPKSLFPELLFKFTEHGTSLHDLADQYSVIYKDLVTQIKTFRQKLNRSYELHYLIQSQKANMSKTSVDKALATKFTEDKLQDLISPSDSKVLTKPETVYAYVYAHTGSNKTACKEAGFLAALKVKDTVSINLLGIYLREKPNIAARITELQKEICYNLDVTKERIQADLVQQIEQLKEISTLDTKSFQSRNTMLKAIELLGKSIGAFQENIKIEEVDPNKALDELIDLAKSDYMVKDAESAT